MWTGDDERMYRAASLGDEACAMYCSDTVVRYVVLETLGYLISYIHLVRCDIAHALDTSRRCDSAPIHLTRTITQLILGKGTPRCLARASGKKAECSRSQDAQ